MVRTDDDLIFTIDVSSLLVKVAVVTAKGKPVAAAQQPYTILTDDDAGFAKSFDVGELWSKIGQCSREVLHRVKNPRARFIAVVSCAQRVACVFLNRDGDVVYGGPNKDTRGVDSQSCIEEVFPAEADLFKITGRGPSLIFALARLLWFREGAAEKYSEIKRVLMLDDWIAYKLSGRYCTDPTTASDSQFFDITKREWSQQIIEGFHFDPAIFPEIVNPGSVVGELVEETAKHLGIPPRIPVIKGGADSQITILGTGCIEPGQVGISLGSTATANLVVAEPTIDPGQNFWTNCYVLPGTWFIEANAGFTGGLYNWFKENFLKDLSGDLDALTERFLQETPPGANATFAFLGPELMNFKDQTQIKRSAFVFPDQGSISTIITNRAGFTRALYENIGFGVLENYQALKTFNPSVTRLFCGGGMSKSGQFMQMLANILDTDIYVPVVRDSAITGAMISALVGLKEYPTYQKVIADIVKHDISSPKRDLVEAYKNVYRQWKDYKATIAKL
jgi:autoinducer 2 (AI-2) kinase